VPELLACSECGRTLTETSGGRCPDCSLQLGRENTAQRIDTSQSHADPQLTGAFIGSSEARANTTGDGAGAKSIATRDWSDSHPRPSDGPFLTGLPVLFGNYELQEELGRGGMGVVFRAVQAVARREVAVKVLLGGTAGDALHGGRFAAEVSALANLRHPNIVAVFEVGEVGGSAFFSMEYAPNGTLAGRLQHGPMPFIEAAVLVGKLAEATEAAHRLGVLHRDIKPVNVLIGADGEPKLSDFGLAKWVNRDEGLTASGAVMGTPSYMPPEQARDATDVGPAADVYTLGATLYECLTGRPPFLSNDAYSVIHLVLSAEPDTPRSIRPDVPPELEAIALKCLAKKPAQRYGSAQELADDLKRWRSGESTVARPLQRWQRVWRRIKRNWKPLTAAVVLIGAVGITLAAFPRGDKSPRPAKVAEPDPPVVEIEGALKRGETVALIGAAGRPKYLRWAVGVGETSEAQPDHPFLVMSRATGMLELTPDSHNDRFRLTAEFKQDESLTIHSSAGIYFSHKVGPAGSRGSAERVVLIRFEDDMINNLPRNDQFGNPLTLNDVLIARTENAPFRLHSSTIETYWVKEVKPVGSTRPWRKLVVEVTPDTIQAHWRNPDGSMQPIRAEPIRSEELHQNVPNIHLPELAKTYPGIEFAGLDHSPRGGVGLYIRDARVFFKNVILEPRAP
jgi:eukaryotic-like serine/threonine-protein kinase